MLIFVPLALCLLVASVSIVAQAESKPSSDKVDCVTWTTEARFVGYAYNHYVHLKSACKEAMVCKVTTNVNKEPIEVTLPSEGEATALTFKGSPASSFTATVTCEKK